MIRIELTSDVLDVGKLIESVRADHCGAVVAFEGDTRSTVDKPVKALEYEAHETLARHQLSEIAASALEHWKVASIVVAHRVGLVPPKEAGVVVAVAAQHRDVAFDAARHVIDTLKRDAAIWKKEIYPDGRSHWVGL